MVRVALITPTLENDGGVAAHARESAAALSGAGMEVSLLAAGPTEAIVRILKERAPDVVHLHDIADPALVEVSRSIAPVVAGAHGHAGCPANTRYFSPGRECERAYGPGCLGNMALRGCAHSRDPRLWLSGYRAVPARLAGLAAADLVTVYSRAGRDHLRRNGLARTALVPLFTTMRRAPPAPSPARVLFVGRIVPAKGLEVLLQAMGLLDCHLDVVGDGWQAPAMRRLAERSGLAGRVTFHGWRSPQEVAAAYAAAAVVAVPSVWPEPFGLVGIDALASGRPVVASDTGGIPDWLDHGETGFLVQPGDPGQLAAGLRTLIADAGRAREMGELGAARVAERFSAPAHVAALREVYVRARERWLAEAGRAA